MRERKRQRPSDLQREYQLDEYLQRRTPFTWKYVQRAYPTQATLRGTKKKKRRRCRVLIPWIRSSVLFFHFLFFLSLENQLLSYRWTSYVCFMIPDARYFLSVICLFSSLFPPPPHLWLLNRTKQKTGERPPQKKNIRRQ